jgi:cytochrome c oxidase cbb3-type subunit 3
MKPARRVLTWISWWAAAALVGGCSKAPNVAGQGVEPAPSFSAAVSAQGRLPLDLSLATGKYLYGRFCSVCHGDTGGGDGFNAYNVSETFGVNPRSFTDRAQMASLKDAEALTAIRDGGPAVGKSAAMPAWGLTLTPLEVADVWQYVGSLAAPQDVHTDSPPGQVAPPTPGR